MVNKKPLVDINGNIKLKIMNKIELLGLRIKKLKL